MEICRDSHFLSLILFIKYLLKIMGILVPVILILVVTIDLVKNIINPDNKENSDLRLTGKRIAGAIIFFLIPLFVNFIMNLLGQSAKDSYSCWKNANIKTIKEIKEIEERK